MGTGTRASHVTDAHTGVDATRMYLREFDDDKPLCSVIKFRIVLV